MSTDKRVATKRDGSFSVRPIALVTQVKKREVPAPQIKLPHWVEGDSGKATIEGSVK